MAMHHPDLDHAGRGEQEEDECLAGGGDLGRDQRVALVDPVGEHAAERRQQHRRAELEHGDEPELDRRATERQDQPRQADLLHPGARSG